MNATLCVQSRKAANLLFRYPIVLDALAKETERKGRQPLPRVM